jgi:hypothetical protein
MLMDRVDNIMQLETATYTLYLLLSANDVHLLRLVLTEGS